MVAPVYGLSRILFSVAQNKFFKVGRSKPDIVAEPNAKQVPAFDCLAYSALWYAQELLCLSQVQKPAILTVQSAFQVLDLLPNDPSDLVKKRIKGIFLWLAHKNFASGCPTIDDLGTGLMLTVPHFSIFRGSIQSERVMPLTPSSDPLDGLESIWVPSLALLTGKQF